MDEMNNTLATKITDEVLEQVGHTVDPRFRQISEALVRHLHAFVTEVRLRPKEWEAAIEFLTKTGQLCTPTRQEFVMLSDTLGVSSLVNVLNRHPGEAVTESTVLGPFFSADAPEVALGEDIAKGAIGTPLYVTGEVRSEDGTPLKGAVVDTWQSDGDGYYDVQRDRGTWLRARFRTDANGAFSFWSVVPSSYPLPNDGPVGMMLRAQGRHPYRPAHLHFKIGVIDHHELVTHLFLSGDPYLDSDAVFSVVNSLIKESALHEPGTAPDGRLLDVTYANLSHTFVLASKRATGATGSRQD